MQIESKENGLTGQKPSAQGVAPGYVLVGLLGHHNDYKL